MNQIKYRWKLWKVYTTEIDKTVHCIILAIFPVLATALLINFSWISILGIAGYTVIAYALIMKDVWHNAYHRTETLRALGWHVTDQLHKWSFINITKSGAGYHIAPDDPAEDPDEFSTEAYTDEIVIRRGIDGDGREFTAYRIPDDLDDVVAIGLLETTKQQYLADVMEGEDNE